MAIVVRRQLDSKIALMVQTKYADPDAVLSRGNRHIILAPWRGKYTLIGVNSRVYTDNAYDLVVTEAELEDFVAEINGAYPALALKRDDIAVVNAGLLPFGENDPGSKDLSFGKRSVIIDHEATDGLKGLVTGMSIRWTMGRLLGQRVVDIAERKVRQSVSRSRTDRTPVWGGDIPSRAAVEQQIRTAVPNGLTPEQISRVSCSYGGDWRSVIASGADSTQRVADSDYLVAEVQHAVRREMAATLTDVMMRRLDMGTGERPTPATVEACASLVAAELGWDAARRSREIERVNASYPFASPGSQLPVSLS